MKFDSMLYDEILRDTRIAVKNNRAEEAARLLEDLYEILATHPVHYHYERKMK